MKAKGKTEVVEFLGEAVRVPVTFFELDELVAATHTAPLEVVLAERRAPYATESERFRLYVEATRPAPASEHWI